MMALTQSKSTIAEKILSLLLFICSFLLRPMILGQNYTIIGSSLFFIGWARCALFH